MNAPASKNEVTRQEVSIHRAFVNAQMSFAPALKTHSNPMFKSKYADLAACIEAVIDSLNANGFALYQPIVNSEKQEVGVKTVIRYITGEEIDFGTLFLPAVKNDPQGYGSAVTYARRYSLMAAMGIAQEDDDGNRAVQSKRNAEAEQAIALEQAMTNSYRAAALNGTAALGEFHKKLENSELKAKVWGKHRDSLKAAAAKADEDNAVGETA